MGFSLKVEAWVSNHQRRGIVSNCASWEEQLRGFGVLWIGALGQHDAFRRSRGRPLVSKCIALKASKSRTPDLTPSN